MTTGIADRIFGGPDPETIASASLESMRAQNRLIVFAARYVRWSPASSSASAAGQLGADADPARRRPLRARPVKLQPKDVSWDTSSQTLKVKLPEIEVAGPDVDINAVKEYGGGGVLSTLTNANQQLDQANRARAVADLRKQATAAVPMQLAHQAARHAVERSFAMPLLAAGFKDVKVVARFPTEGDRQALLSSTFRPHMRRRSRKRSAAAPRKGEMTVQTASLKGLDLLGEIERLKRERNAVILAHYYQKPEIQDLADFVGDSLDLRARRRRPTPRSSPFAACASWPRRRRSCRPEKIVILPDMDAGCSLEDSCPPDQFAAFRAAHPDHIALTYINCSAAVKALRDIIVTS